jgi:nickel/cobalt exporter
MTSIITGSIVISLLHALMPNHWLPVVTVGRKEGWSLAEVLRIVFIAGCSHVISTLAVGFLLALAGKSLSARVNNFTDLIAPLILIALGTFFLFQHYRHHHFDIDKKLIAKKTKQTVITSLVIAMFFSPCLEIEGYFLMAGANGYKSLLLIAALYTAITLAGMLLWVRVVYKGLSKFNWHKWEHNAGMITGIVLIFTGLITFIIK